MTISRQPLPHSAIADCVRKLFQTNFRDIREGMAMNSQTAALNPSALIASRQQQHRFVPQAGTKENPKYLVVQFPGESMRCPVVKVIDENTVIIRIDSPPISRVHSFRFEEIVGVRRRTAVGRQDSWEAQTERDFLAEQKRKHASAEDRKPKPAPQPKVAPAKQAASVAPAPKKVAAKKPSPAKRKTAAPAKAAPKRKAAR